MEKGSDGNFKFGFSLIFFMKAKDINTLVRRRGSSPCAVRVHDGSLK